MSSIKKKVSQRAAELSIRNGKILLAFQKAEWKWLY